MPILKSESCRLGGAALSRLHMEAQLLLQFPFILYYLSEGIGLPILKKHDGIFPSSVCVCACVSLYFKHILGHSACRDSHPAFVSMFTCKHFSVL